jgi:hypothetical protein
MMIQGKEKRVGVSFANLCFANLYNFANLWSARQRATIAVQRYCSFFANLCFAKLYSSQGPR